MDAAENQIVVYQPNVTVRLDVRLENETVWLTQKLIGIDAYPGGATLDMLRQLEPGGTGVAYHKLKFTTQE